MADGTSVCVLLRLGVFQRDESRCQIVHRSNRGCLGLFGEGVHASLLVGVLVQALQLGEVFVPLNEVFHQVEAVLAVLVVFLRRSYLTARGVLVC